VSSCTSNRGGGGEFMKAEGEIKVLIISIDLLLLKKMLILNNKKTQDEN